jgi:hypothetical protein
MRTFCFMTINMIPKSTDFEIHIYSHIKCFVLRFATNANGLWFGRTP